MKIQTLPKKLLATLLNNRSSKNYGHNFGSWLKTFCKGFGLLLTYEIIEELIEELIAYTITTVIAKALSFLLVVILTQSVKITAKSLAKGLTIALKPTIKKFTYKAGNDKIIKIMRLIDMCKEKVKNNKFLQFLKRNPKSILGIIGGMIASLSGGALTTGTMHVCGVQLPLWAMILIGAVACIGLFIFIALGVKGAGFENSTKELLRKTAEKLGYDKAVEAIDKAEADFEAEQAKQAEEEAKAIAEAKAKYNQEFINAVVNGTFDGSLEDFIEIKQKAEQEAKQAAEEAQRQQKLVLAKTAYVQAVANGEFTGSFADWLNK